MHGGGTVSGSQVVALQRSNNCWARLGVTQQKQPNQRSQIRRNQPGRSRRRSGVSTSGRRGSCKLGRASMISCSSVSVTTSQDFFSRKVLKVSSNYEKS